MLRQLALICAVLNLALGPVAFADPAPTIGFSGIQQAYSANNAFLILEAAGAPLKTKIWTAFFKAHKVDTSKFNLFEVKVKGNLVSLPGVKGTFALLENGAIEHDGKKFTVDFNLSPEANYKKMLQTWDLKTSKSVGLFGLILPKAWADDDSDRAFALGAGTGISAITMGLIWAAVLRTSESVVIGGALVCAGVALFLWGRAQQQLLKNVTFSCKGGFTKDGINVDAQLAATLQGNPDDPASKKFGTPAELMTKGLNRACAANPQQTQSSMSKFLSAMSAVQAKSDPIPASSAGLPAPVQGSATH